MDDETFNKVAKHDFILRTAAGFILGILLAVGGIIAAIVCCLSKRTELVGMFISIAVVAAIVAAICGAFLFRKKEKKENEKLE